MLGQPRSTIDLRRVIADGGILFVSTAQGEVGKDVSSLVGASLMNLIDAVIREQGSLPPEKRRSVTVVVDEMQAMTGVDYESMLGELGKFGASLFLATQGLDKLDDLSQTLRGTLLSNVGCLAVFQGGGRGCEAPRMGARQGSRIRGRRHLPGGAPLLRAGDRRRGAPSCLLNEGARAGEGKAGDRRARRGGNA